MTIGVDRTLSLWETATGQKLRREELTDDVSVSCCAWHVDGRRIITGESYSERDPEYSEKFLSMPPAKRAALEGIGWTAETWGRRLVHVVRVRNLRSLEIELELYGHEKAIGRVAVSPDGAVIGSAADSGDLRLWNSRTGEQIAATNLGSSVHALVFSTCHPHLAAALEDGSIRVLDSTDGHERARIVLTPGSAFGSVNDCSISQDGRLLVCACDNGTVALCDLHSGELLAKTDGHRGRAQACAIAPDGSTFITGANDGELKVWDADRFIQHRANQSHRGTITGCAFSPAGDRVVSVSYDKTLKLWSAATGLQESVVQFEIMGPVTACDLSADGRIACWDTAGSLFIVDPNTTSIIGGFEHLGHVTEEEVWALQREIEGRAPTSNEIAALEAMRRVREEVNATAFSPDGRFIATASNDGAISLCESTTSENRYTFRRERAMKDCAFSPDGSRIVSASEDKTVRIWSLAKRTEVATLLGHNSGVQCCAYSKDGRRIVSGSGMLIVWNAITGQELRRINTGSVSYACDFSPDGTIVAAALADRSVQLWNVEDGCRLGVFPGATRFTSLAFSPSGDSIACGDGDGGFFLLRLGGVLLNPPVVTLVHNFRSNSLDYDEAPTAPCPFCHARFCGDEQALAAMGEISNHGRYRFVEDLQNSSWNDARLLVRCPHCEAKLKLNPFIVDGRVHKWSRKLPAPPLAETKPQIAKAQSATQDVGAASLSVRTRIVTASSLMLAALLCFYFGYRMGNIAFDMALPRLGGVVAYAGLVGWVAFGLGGGLIFIRLFVRVVRKSSLRTGVGEDPEKRR